MQWIRRLKEKDTWLGTGTKLARNINKVVGGWIEIGESWLCVEENGELFNIVQFYRVHKGKNETHGIAFRGIKGQNYIGGSDCVIWDPGEWRLGYGEYWREHFEVD